jgi:hypothetical protein
MPTNTPRLNNSLRAAAHTSFPCPPLQLQPTPIDTRGFQSLLSLVDNTANDSFELYYGLFMYNQVGTVQYIVQPGGYSTVHCTTRWVQYSTLYNQVGGRWQPRLGL